MSVKQLILQELIPGRIINHFIWQNIKKKNGDVFSIISGKLSHPTNPNKHVSEKTEPKATQLWGQSVTFAISRTESAA